jgi:hypothetical protein
MAENIESMLIKQKVLFSKDECDLIINLFKDNPQKWNSQDRKYNSQPINYSLETQWLFDKLKKFVETETKIEFRSIKKQIHFHKFVKEDWFGKHNDNRDSRIYAVGVLLNENFKGGDFKLYNPIEQTLDKVVGNTYLFDVRIEHEITPILDGERFSLLWFLQIENIKPKINKLL